MLTIFRAPDLAATSVEIPDPNSTTSPGLAFLIISEIVSNKSGDAAQLRVAGIAALKSKRFVN